MDQPGLDLILPFMLVHGILARFYRSVLIDPSTSAFIQHLNYLARRNGLGLDGLDFIGHHINLDCKTCGITSGTQTHAKH